MAPIITKAQFGHYMEFCHIFDHTASSRQS